MGSLSSWRAWIEITASHRKPASTGRSPHGERGLKSEDALLTAFDGGRSPHGERGLKFIRISQKPQTNNVALLMESVD